MLNIAIVEDDDREAKMLTDGLHRYAQEHKNSFSIQRFSDGVSFLCNEKQKYDLIFMDVEMPIMDGLQTAAKLREKDSQVVLVFVTKLFQYAVNGYEYDAADYIIKPIRYPSFSLKMEKIEKRCRRSTEKFLELKYSGGMKIVPQSSLSNVALQGHRIIYHTYQGELTYYGNGKQIEDMLPEEDFFRCNSGYFVNLQRVTGMDGFTVFLGDTELLVSHARRKAFIEALHAYLARQK